MNVVWQPVALRRGAAGTLASIGYTSALTDYAIDQADGTEIIQKQLANPDVDVFTGSAFPNAATATTEQKVAAAQAYLNQLSVDDRATVYRKCMTTPDDATLDAALTQTMATFTRDEAKEMADNGIFEASGKTAQQMKEMIDAMDDETFTRFFRPYLRAMLSMQMQQETVKSYSGMTSQEIISAINAHEAAVRPPEQQKPSGASASRRFSTPAISSRQQVCRRSRSSSRTTGIDMRHVAVASELAVGIIVAGRKRHDIVHETDKGFRLAGEDDRGVGVIAVVQWADADGVARRDKTAALGIIDDHGKLCVETAEHVQPLAFVKAKRGSHSRIRSRTSRPRRSAAHGWDESRRSHRCTRARCHHA